MSNFKWGFLAGAIALVVSFSVGIISGANILNVILRAFIFGVMFFGFGFGIRILIYNYLPEILSVVNDDEEEDTLSKPGSKVDITLDSTRDFAMPEMYRNPNKPEEVGDIANIVSVEPEPVSRDSEPSAGIDQKQEEDYNYGVVSAPAVQTTATETGGQDYESKPDAPAFTPSFGSGSSDLGGLPDLDAMAGAFISGGGQTSSAPSAEPGWSPSKAPEGDKAKPMEGDFNPKELAEGIRTILAKEKQ